LAINYIDANYKTYNFSKLMQRALNNRLVDGGYLTNPGDKMEAKEKKLPMNSNS
jgi:hypothetical protein